MVEIVSNQKVDELGGKYHKYEQMRVPIYVVLDPEKQIQDERLTVYALNGFGYHKLTGSDSYRFPEIGLGLTLWEGEFEKRQAQWLRWTDLAGNLIATGEEQRVRAEQEAARAEQEKARADRLAALLREAGIEPDA